MSYGGEKSKQIGRRSGVREIIGGLPIKDCKHFNDGTCTLCTKIVLLLGINPSNSTNEGVCDSVNQPGCNNFAAS